MDDIKKCDLTVIVIVVLMIIARILTVGYISFIQDTTGAEYNNVASVIESNPVAKIFLTSKGIYSILQHMILPGFAVAAYMYFRRKVKDGKMDVASLMLSVNFTFMVMLLDVTNDIAVVTGALL